MNTILSFMDKLYSDSETLKIVYVVGAVLLFIFIVMLIISLRKPEKTDKTKIIEEPKIDETPIIEEKIENVSTNENVKEEIDNNKIETTPLEEQSIFEKTRIIPLDELRESEEKEEVKEEKIVEEPKTVIEEKASELSKDIPDIDSYVDNIVKKTYEKNEQFSSVYVKSSESTTLDKVLDDMNVDNNIKEEIIPEEEKPEIKVEENKPEPTEQVKENNSLDALKQALDEKKKEVELKQDELKMKLQGLKKETESSNETLKAEELLNKLNNIKEN